MNSRVLIFTTHPIQYQAPWFRSLSTDPALHVRVCFSLVPDPKAQGAGFGQPFAWDFPLREGYESTVLNRVPGFAGTPLTGVNTGIFDEIDSFRPDVALVLGWQDPSLLQALIACRVRRVPVIMRGESNDRKKRTSLVRMLHHVLLKQPHAFLAIGNSNASFYRSYGIKDEQISFARYFVDNERFRIAADASRKERSRLRSNWGIPETEFCAVFVGKLEPKKHVLDFLNGVASARREGAFVHPLVVGTGEQMREARELAAALDLDASFVGFLNQSEIPKAYVAADALVLPSNADETWGLVCNEAMACGTPAIVSDQVGCAGDLVVDGNTGRIVRFGDVKAIGEALTQWSRNPAVYKEIQRRSRAHVFSNYSIESAVAGLKQAIAIGLPSREAAG